VLDILICDDHPIVRQGLARILLANLETESVREACDGRRLLELVRQKPADVILLDLGLPDRGGLDVLRQVREVSARVPVLILSVHPADQYALRALRAGASGYLTKDLAPDELVKAVQTVLAGHRYVTPQVAECLADELDRPTSRSAHETLSDREFEIFGQIALGKTVKQIASDLCLGYSTISTYRARVLTKLGLKTDAEIIRYAIRWGLAE
jgi:two-component system, NarL family, invasion response regulator UvrY